jgi:hypothetical protein
MPAPEYTTCVNPDQYQDPRLPSGNFFQTLGGVIANGGIDLLLRVCDYMLHGKLVCLGGDRCAIGRVASFETVDDKSGFDKIDNDFCINLALCPDPLGSLQTGAKHRIDNYNSAVSNKQGWLIKEEPGMPMPFDPGKVFSTDPPIIQLQPSARYGGTFVRIHTILSLSNPIPEKIANESDSDTWHLPILHTEIEGNRATYVCAAANAMLGPIHNTVCKIPWIGGFLCFVLTILALPFLAAVLAILSTAWVAGSNDNRDFDGGGDLKADDLVLIRGRWTYDAGHQGWNELHPVKHIQKIPDDSVCQWSDFDDLYQRWCEQAAKIPPTPAGAGGAAPQGMTPDQQATWDTQVKPEHRWYFHPLVDGCTPDSSPPDIR